MTKQSCAGPDGAGQPTRTRGTHRLVLMTAGGTREPIDDVRHISNIASGGLPAAMAEHWLSLGATVHYVHGPGARIPGRMAVALPLLADAERPALSENTENTAFERALAAIVTEARQRRARCRSGELHCYAIQTAAEAGEQVFALAAALHPDVAACAMAVADFAPEPIIGKLVSRPGGAVPDALHLTLLPTAKVIDGVRRASPTTQLLGFKLLSGADEPSHVAAARALAARAGATWVFSNDMQDYRRGVRRGVLRDAAGLPLEALGGANGLPVAALAHALVDAIERRLVRS